eukprot:TRINITY_DN4407_c0_g2_i1.p2 TRINITY_DN4407_c0_g2~~TRINITY_DN4407_c0_g2_i1.p2  ORF type:complete len:468 (-),score=66.60 TRINITY_DN4407_c0_g2_i1:543-1946(-)
MSQETQMAEWKVDIPDTQDTEAITRRENYIPFRLQDLVERVQQSYPDTFYNDTIKKQFNELVERLSTYTKLRLNKQMAGCINGYTWVDPDNDIVLPRELSEVELESKTKEFITKTIIPVLEEAGFLEVQRHELDEALERKNASGIQVIPPPENMLYYKMFLRGRVKVEKTVKNWRTLWYEKKFIETEYKRLFVVFSLDDDEAIRLKLEQDDEVKLILSTEEVKKDEKAVEMVEYPWWQFWHIFSGPKHIKIKGLKPDMVYMKMFKDISVGEIDQVIPGTRVKFSLLDYLMVFVPVLFGFGAAVYKAASGSFDFDTLAATLTTLGLVCFPLLYGFKAYQGLQQRNQDLRAKLNEIFLLYNLSNNAGVLSYLLEEAQEQEDREIIMAYFFLWKNQKPLSKEQLDLEVEEFLSGIMEKFHHTMKFDFDVSDAIGDCVRMGFANEIAPNMYQAADLSVALEKVALKNFPQN